MKKFLIGIVVGVLGSLFGSMVVFGRFLVWLDKHPKAFDVFKNSIVDWVEVSIRTFVYGEQSYRESRDIRYPFPRTTYGGIVSRPFFNTNPQFDASDKPRVSKFGVIVFPTEKEAARVLEALQEIAAKHLVVSLADLHRECNFPVDEADKSIGWTSLENSEVRRFENGFRILLPPTQIIPLAEEKLT